jgi:Domain of unknown function (DUF1848).
VIVSASRRTDLPRWYSEWFLNRVRAGYALVRNPMNASQLRRVDLTPCAVDCFVFWSKDPANLLTGLCELDTFGYSYYFQFTLTPYGHALEPNMRDKREIEATFVALSKQIGRERVVWRYDPIILNEFTCVEYHKREFKRLCGKLAPCTDTVTISFVDMYAKLKTDLIRPLTDGEVAELAGFIGETARAHGLRAVACCESADLSGYGIGRAACVDSARIEKLTGRKLSLPSDKNQRQGCGCVASVDLGAYNTCPAGCVYCYANNPGKDGSFSSALRRWNAHDPAGELLCGGSDASGTRL